MPQPAGTLLNLLTYGRQQINEAINWRMVPSEFPPFKLLSTLTTCSSQPTHTMELLHFTLGGQPTHILALSHSILGGQPTHTMVLLHSILGGQPTHTIVLLYSALGGQSTHTVVLLHSTQCHKSRYSPGLEVFLSKNSSVTTPTLDGFPPRQVTTLTHAALVGNLLPLPQFLSVYSNSRPPWVALITESIW